MNVKCVPVVREVSDAYLKSTQKRENSKGWSLALMSNFLVVKTKDGTPVSTCGAACKEIVKQFISWNVAAATWTDSPGWHRDSGPWWPKSGWIPRQTNRDLTENNCQQWFCETDFSIWCRLLTRNGTFCESHSSFVCHNMLFSLMSVSFSHNSAVHNVS